MADLDDLREGCNFGLGVASTNNSFHVKGAEHLPWGMKDRLSRIFNPKTGRTVMLAFDHGFIFIFLIKHDNIATLWFFFLICMTVSDEPVMNHQCRFHTLRWHPPDHQKTTECDNNGKKNCYVNHPPHDIFSFLFCLFVHRFLPVCFSFGINHIIPKAKMYKFF